VVVFVTPDWHSASVVLSQANNGWRINERGQGLKNISRLALVISLWVITKLWGNRSNGGNVRIMQYHSNLRVSEA